MVVRFSEIFYKAADFDPSVKHLDLLRRIVFVDGLSEAVKHEDLKWQQFDPETGQYVGVCRFPIRVLTLTYVSDECVPPSDSEMGRPQVDEMMRSRSQLIQQRDHSRPMRWANTDKVDPALIDQMNRGTWQAIIPVQGDGGKMMGEIARANYPAEDWNFQNVTKQDLEDAWGLGPNQLGRYASGERSATEAATVQQSFASLIAVERGKVSTFFCSIAETIGGLMQLFYDKQDEILLVGEEDAERSAQVWDRSRVAGAKFVYSIREDATVRLDSEQRIQQLLRLYNLAGKDPMLNRAPLLEEIVSLTGLDPAKFMVQPEQPRPEPANFSARVNGDDLTNPFVVALLQREQQVTPEELEAAKQLIAASMTPPAPPAIAGEMPPPQAVEQPEHPGPVPHMERILKRTEVEA